MSDRTADVVICGSGIAGIATAYWLAVHHGVRDVLIVDDRPPLSLTSDKSTEAYRNWWPGPDDAMISFMDRSIDLLEELAGESGNVFHLNRRGYLYATGDPERARVFEAAAAHASKQGAGPVRFHHEQAEAGPYEPSAPDGFGTGPAGADLITDHDLLRRHFPYLSEKAVAVLHPRRCGWFSGQQLGMWLLERARDAGVRSVSGQVVGVRRSGPRIEAIDVRREQSVETIHTRNFVNAAGPFIKHVASLIDVDLPVFSELHIKAALDDELGAIPREAPLLIWEDPQTLSWTDEERAALAESEDTRRLLETFPASVHCRPEGGPGSRNVLLLWPYHTRPVPEVFPLPEDPDFPEIVLRGMATMIPALGAYLDRLPRMFVDGGYYTKTPENRFLSCPLPVDGCYVIGALSGYGLMAACGAAEIVTAHVAGATPPAYAPAFSLERYDNDAYRKRLESWGSTGQL